MAYLVHSFICKEQGRVIVGDHRGTRDERVGLFIEVADEHLSYLFA